MLDPREKEMYLLQQHFGTNALSIHTIEREEIYEGEVVYTDDLDRQIEEEKFDYDYADGGGDAEQDRIAATIW